MEPFRPVQDSRPDDVVWPQATWPPLANVRLIGRHVTLSPATPADAAPLFTALDDDRVWLHVAGRPQTAQDLATTLAAAPATGRHPYVVRVNEALADLPAGSVVGTTSLFDGSAADARCEIGHTTYSPAAWGTVVNPEAKLLLLSLCFEGLRLGRVQLKTDVRNARSQRAIAGIGATYEGVLRRYQRRADGTVRDSVLFSITAEDWPAVRARLRDRLAQA